MAFDDGEGAIDLFREHDRSQFVRQRHGTQRQYKPIAARGGFLQYCFRPAIGGPYSESEQLYAAVLLALQPLRECL